MSRAGRAQEELQAEHTKLQAELATANSARAVAIAEAAGSSQAAALATEIEKRAEAERAAAEAMRKLRETEEETKVCVKHPLLFTLCFRNMLT